MIRTKIWPALLLWVALQSVLWAEVLPHWPVHWMCADADAIVVGERVGASLVKVEEWLLPPVDGQPAAEEVEIVGLEDHTRLIGDGRLVRANDGTVIDGPLKSDRLICFLERKGVAWYSLGTAGQGSAGLRWIEEGRSYRYTQLINPGPYILTPEGDQTEKMVRSEIERGLGDRRDWEAALEIVHPRERAVVLASYLLPRTSPEGDRGTYQRRVRRELPKLGAPAVAELVELLQTARESDPLAEAILNLNDIGPAARPALPYLVDLLDRPERLHPVVLLEALGRIGDASAAPRILPLLSHEELRVRSEAARALAAFRYHDAAEEIAQCLPERVQPGDAYYVYAALVALKELDPDRAATLAKRYAGMPAMKNVRNLLEPLFEANRS